jgi:phosphate starvation-inducible protein PhoH and related proteins
MASKRRTGQGQNKAQSSTNRQPKNLKQVNPLNDHQKQYLDAIENNIVVISSGPAGSGKTYLAVYEALKFHWSKQIKRIVITRPAIEAGERLGFLPGGLEDKVHPYMRPIYDGLYDLIGPALALEKIEKGYIEIAPLAYMRGRTFHDAFVILDEAQNATLEQLKMAVTRIGENCKMVINGDPAQTDLPRNKEPGLLTLQRVVNDIKNVSVVQFNKGDIVRSRVVTDIVEAFEKYEENNE